MLRRDVVGLVLLWMVVQDIVKLALYRIAESGGTGTLPFVQILRQPLDTHVGLHHHVYTSRTVD